MNKNLIKLLVIPLAILLLLGYNYFSQKTAENGEIQQYIDDISEFSTNGKIQVVKTYPYEGKLELKENQKAIALQIRVTPQNSVIDIDDIELHSKSGEFLGYAIPSIWLDENGKEMEFDEEKTPYYYVVIFEVPQDFQEGEIKYSDKSHDTFSL